jgi:hypothetical protein
VGYVIILYDPAVVIMAAFMTLGITVALTIYAFLTKEDFTVCGGMLFIMISALLMFGLFTIFVGGVFLHKVYCLIGACIYGIYIVYDT